MTEVWKIAIGNETLSDLKPDALASGKTVDLDGMRFRIAIALFREKLFRERKLTCVRWALPTLCVF